MPPNLSDKYRPESIAEFAGLERPRALLSALADKPYSSAWLLVGPSGLGKTTMVMALQKQIGGQFHHIPSRKCDLATVDSVVRSCWYTPMSGGPWHVVLVDEADKMTTPAQLAFLSVLDATASPPETIFFFTANATRSLEDRFKSRCRVVRFTTEGITEPGIKLLAKIWRKETKAKPPDFAAILRENDFNIRSSLHGARNGNDRADDGRRTRGSGGGCAWTGCSNCQPGRPVPEAFGSRAARVGYNPCQKERELNGQDGNKLGDAHMESGDRMFEAG